MQNHLRLLNAPLGARSKFRDVTEHNGKVSTGLAVGGINVTYKAACFVTKISAAKFIVAYMRAAF
jgi:hypothetical protein